MVHLTEEQIRIVIVSIRTIQKIGLKAMEMAYNGQKLTDKQFSAGKEILYDLMSYCASKLGPIGFYMLHQELQKENNYERDTEKIGCRYRKWRNRYEDKDF